MSVLKIVYGLFGHIWVPQELRNLKETVILHLSDTPSSFLWALPGLLRQVNPTWIIHTGDLVDNVKLELKPNHLAHYTVKVQQLIHILESSEAQGVFLCIGNHDDLKAVSEGSTRTTVIPDFEQLKLGSAIFGVSHYAKDALAAGGDFCLFGHNFDRKTDLTGAPLMLNGLEAIYIILPESGRVFSLKYPTGTDDQRLGRGKVGL